MRTDIYYWKCDNPLSTAEKKRSYFADKYDRAGLDDTVLTACRRVLGEGPLDVEPLRVDGNHLAYRVTHAGAEYFFRADDGSGDDDYLQAESALMQRAADAGVPVPRVWHTDASLAQVPFRFQIMELCPYPALSQHDRAGTLDRQGIARQLGTCLRRLHSVPIEGFGFIDTEELKRTGRIRGLDATYRAYFNRRFDDHLGHLRESGLLTPDECGDIEHQFRRHAPRFERRQGFLVHRDAALWNVLGTPDRIAAVIDWDDAVSGDPADDLGMLGCFHDGDFMQSLFDGYGDGAALPEDFVARIRLHTLRNMLWKTKLRHALGYFDKDADFFLHTSDVQKPLRAHTLGVLRNALDRVRSLETP